MRRSAPVNTETSIPPAEQDARRAATDGSGPATPARDIARYGQDLEERYIAARNRWTLAMHTAGSGRAADLASLAIAQQAYEEVADEREHWLASGRVAIPIEPAPKRHDIEVAIGQELAWRDVQERQPPDGLLARIRRRFGSR